MLPNTPQAILPYQVSSAWLVAWIPYDNNHFVPEVWKYTLPPDENCRCLNLRERMWGLRDIQTFAVIADRHFFFARDSEQSATYTTCVEIVL